MESSTEESLRNDPFPGLKPRLELVRGGYHGAPRSMRAGVTAVTVMVAHSTPLIAAGMASLLARQPTLEVRVWDEAQGPWDGGGMNAVDIVFADSECLRLSRWNHCAVAQSQASAPKVVWVTTVSDELRHAQSKPAGISAELSVECGEFDLVEALQSLTQNRSTIRNRSHPAKPTGGLAPGAIRRVKEHIEQHLSERIELMELARLAGLSECHFSRAFKQSIGLPPHRYLMTRRITAAADLVSKTDRALSEIALEVGFCDQSHFTRLFSTMVGETPRAFRQRHR